MHVWQWWITGLVAGLISRVALRGKTIGLPGELALGSLGGITCGAVAYFAGITGSESAGPHVLASLLGAVGTIAMIHGLLQGTMQSRRVVSAAETARDLQSRLSQLGESEARVVRKFLEREPVSQDASLTQLESATLGERWADRIASFGGSWSFLGLFGALMSAWMLFNVEQSRPFDPYPFILLNLVLSCLAAVQAPVILMSQNRQSQKDRLHAHADYEVNLKAEIEILALHEKIDELRERAWRELVQMQERQLALLEKLEHPALPASGPGAPAA
jgi:uncharacterized membrane protein/uncharacterized membrane protein YeaQ/YmgE (transglycosylase-associated protein family)